MSHFTDFTFRLQKIHIDLRIFYIAPQHVQIYRCSTLMPKFRALFTHYFRMKHLGQYLKFYDLGLHADLIKNLLNFDSYGLTFKELIILKNVALLAASRRKGFLLKKKCFQTFLGDLSTSDYHKH